MEIRILILQKQPLEVLCKKVVLKNFVNFIGKVFFLVSLKGLWHRCFPVKFAKFLRTSILKNICEQLLLILSSTEVAFKADETCNCHLLGRPGNKANFNKIVTRFIARLVVARNLSNSKTLVRTLNIRTFSRCTYFCEWDVHEVITCKWQKHKRSYSRSLKTGTSKKVYHLYERTTFFLFSSFLSFWYFVYVHREIRKTICTYIVRHYLFSTDANSSEKLTFLNPW